MKVWRSISTGLLLLLVAAAAGCTAPEKEAADSEGTQEKVVYVYSARHYGQMEPVFQEFMKETGIEVRFTYGKDAELRERLKAEGEFTPADVYISVDAGNLWLAAQEGLLQPVKSDVLESNIPQNLRDPENRWFGLTMRIRTIVYNTERVSPQELSTYEDLADPKWKDRLCLRPSTKVYTQSLVASLIAAHGEEKAEEIVRGWVENNPKFIDSDTRIIETVAAGGCDVGVVMHYYLARLKDRNPDLPVDIFWANQEDRGVHVNIVGAGVTRYAKNREEAIKLIEWLSSEKGQKLFADGNFEYPVNPRVEPHPIVKEWGEFRIDPINVAEYGRLQKRAIELMERVGYR
ncbi:Fe(3+) ABC transporter substrate-binding protein [Candidatus Pyrohabitans sp.]